VRTGLLAALLLAIGAPGPILAQTIPGNGSSIEVVTVTAERRAENAQVVPMSINAFNAKQIKDLGIKQSNDLGQLVPNLNIGLVAGEGNQPIITIRGIGLNDYDTNNAGPNGVYIDEVYLSSPASQTFEAFDLSDIEVLKGPQGTLFGRNSSGGAILFTSAKPTDQFTADLHVDYSSYDTINVEGAAGGPITNDLDFRVAFVKNNSAGYMHNLFNAQDENGANNWASRAMLQYKPNDQWTFLLNIHGGQVANRPNEYRHLGALDPLTFAPCTAAATNAGQCVDLYGYGTPKKFYDGNWNRLEHLDVNNYGTYLRAEYQYGSITFTSISSFDHNDKFHPEDTDASASGLLDINFGVRNNEYTEELRAAQTTDTYDWQAGFYYLGEKLHQNQPLSVLLDIDSIYGPGVGFNTAFIAYDRSYQVTHAYAVYAQGDYNITDRLKATLGARGTYESKTFNYLGTVAFQGLTQGSFLPLQLINSSYHTYYSSAFNYRAVLDYAFNDDVHSYVSISTGYKSADFNGSFLSTIPEVTAQQLQPAKPEYVTTYEAGFKSQWLDNKLLVNASGFYNDYRDMQLFILAPPPLALCPTPGATTPNCLPNNILSNADAFTAGSDITLAATLFDNFSARIDLGILTTKINETKGPLAPGEPAIAGEQLVLSPHTSLSALLDYKVPFDNGSALDIQFTATYKGHQFFDLAKFQNGTNGPFLEDPYTQQNAYWLENARIGYSLEGGRWEVAAWIRNISDQKYYFDEFNLQSPFGFIQGIVGMPRTIGGEVNFRY
jgi:iron complex outermembrane receptor protein